MKKILCAIGVVLILISWQCSKIDQAGRNLSVKESFDRSVADINTAIGKISASKGYQLISVTEAGAKSELELRDSINLGMVAGIYDFNPNPELHPDLFFPYKLFTKSGPSDKMIVNLPAELVFKPRHLHYLVMADTTLENNFHITATDYHFYYKWWNNYDYKLDAGFMINQDNIGSLSMSSLWDTQSERRYANVFTFPEGFSITKRGQTGDTTKIEFALVQNTDTLLSEKLSLTGDGFKRKEKQYTLSIGNIEIKRATGIDSIQVFLNGVLQKKAGAKIVDNEDYNASIFSRRDILLTFDDGTQAKLSDKLAPALETLKSLSRSLEEMYVSKHIVDYIAFNIYYHR